MTSNTSVWVTVLAGGAGTRFWPLSTSLRPKQLLNLVGRRPLIVDTLERVRGLVPPGNIRVLTGAHLVEPIRRATGLGDESILVETRARGTAPALARAAWEIARSDPDGVMISLHSDHLISPAAHFRDILATAADVARRQDLLVTVAVPPNRPETGYGYIRPGEALSTPTRHTAYRVAAFVEKPGPEDAARYVADGYRWNSGIFVWRAAFFLAELATHAQEVARALPALERGDIATFFDQVESTSVDEALLERSARVAAIDATFDWDDIGGWEAVARLHPPDADGNVRAGEAHVAGGEGNIAFAESGRVVLFGAQDMLVVRTDDITLVMPRSELVRLKEHLRDLPARFTRTTDDGGAGPDSA
ncbi:MAG: sugar phosphate nucleotidyltransferase [Gemmatimonadota bacterium]|nr:sugar phosphate nucleotidyltransferase [Gemmatimonadota bacterium]